MPFYEEKIISPLAIRFTQQRIRSTFQDGREVEASIAEIKAKPGAGDYDVILHAPFPTIEIIRWSPNGRRAGGQDHWFSRDNRRLYCLQRAAAEHWPKRVGAMVEVLFADPGDTRKKLDSQTGGQAVSIGHAFATDDELEKWNWREAIKDECSCGLLNKAEAAVAADDAKSGVHDLMEAPAAPSAYERLCSSFEEEICAPAVASKATASDSAKTPAQSSCKKLSSVPETEMQSSVIESKVMTEEDVKPQEQPKLSPGVQCLSGLIGQLLESAGGETKVMPEEDVEPQEQPSPSSELSPGSQSLSGLIGQLLDSSAVECKVKPEEDITPPEQPPLPSKLSREGQSLSGLIGQLLESSAVEPKVKTPEEDVVKPQEQSEDVKSQEQPSLASESPQNQSLSGLIGQLLVLKSAESPQTSAAACQSGLCDGTESSGSPATVMEAFRASSASGGSDKARSESSAKESAAPAPKQKRAAKAAQQQQAQSSPSRTPSSRGPKQNSRITRAQATQFQRAQMAQWQMAQWQSAQMARWQHASMAYNAAQFQAAQASEWQEAWA